MTHILNDLISGWFPSSLDNLCIISTFFAISVITVKNPVISVLFLIGLFITIGGYLIIIGVGFIGLSYLLVYVGAVSILFLFILMLINVRISELVNETKNSIPLIFLVTLLFGNISYILLPQENALDINIFSWEVLNNTFISTSMNWDSYLIALPHITNIGNIMYSTYAIWLILISFILLLAMVGAIIINVKQKTIQPKENIILQSKFDFSLLRAKLIRLIIIGTSLWCIRYLMINIFELNMSEYIDYLGLLILTGIIQFLGDYYVFSDSRIPMGFDNGTFNKISKYDNINMMEGSRDNIPSRSDRDIAREERDRQLREGFEQFQEDWDDRNEVLACAESNQSGLEELDIDPPKANNPENQEAVDNKIKELLVENKKIMELVEKDPDFNKPNTEAARIGWLYEEKAGLDPSNERDMEKSKELDRQISDLEETLDDKSGGYLRAKYMNKEIGRKMKEIGKLCKSKNDEGE